MCLIDVTLAAKLPPLGAQQYSLDPQVYIEMCLPKTSRKWYVTEGQQEGDDFHLFGYIEASESAWDDFWLSDVEASLNSQGDHIQVGEFPEPQPFSIVVNRSRSNA